MLNNKYLSQTGFQQLMSLIKNKFKTVTDKLDTVPGYLGKNPTSDKLDLKTNGYWEVVNYTVPGLHTQARFSTTPKSGILKGVGTGDNFIQQFFPHKSPEIYEREYENGRWGIWQELTDTKPVFIEPDHIGDTLHLSEHDAGKIIVIRNSQVTKIDLTKLANRTKFEIIKVPSMKVDIMQGSHNLGFVPPTVRRFGIVKEDNRNIIWF